MLPLGFDFNNDDWPDLYVSGQLWRNNQGKFTAVENHGLSGSGTWADFNNDGFLDLFSFDIPCGVYLSNMSDEKESFTKVEGAIPDKLPMEVSLGAAAADFDSDGLIDIYLGGYEIWQKASYHDIVLRNVGNGKFEEVWRTPDNPQPRRVGSSHVTLTRMVMLMFTFPTIDLREICFGKTMEQEISKTGSNHQALLTHQTKVATLDIRSVRPLATWIAMGVLTCSSGISVIRLNGRTAPSS